MSIKTTHTNISRAVIQSSAEAASVNMAGILDVPKPRVHPTGKMFSVSDGEGKTATVELNDPLEEELSGVVEVIGMVSTKGAIMASTYSILREDRGVLFDLELYNEALKLLQDFPQFYPFEVAVSG